MRQRKDWIPILLLVAGIFFTYLLAQYIQAQRPKQPAPAVDVSYPFVLKKRLPNAIIIGVQKGGTRALITFLAHHPSIRTAFQEVNFFNKKAMIDPNHVIYERYRQEMPLSLTNQVTIEKSPNYFHSKEAPRRMYEYQQYLEKKLKLMLTLVPPVERSVSHFFHKLRRNDNDRTMKSQNLTKALMKPLQHNHYLKVSLYGKHLSNWLQYFGLDQFLIINGTTLAHENPSTTLQKCEEFLGVPNYFASEMFNYQPQKGFYCYGKTSEGCLGDDKGQLSYPQKLPQEVSKKLEEKFVSDQFLLFQLTALNFSRIL